MGMTYKQAGVDVEAGYKAVELMKKHVSRTFNKNVLSDIGGFGGLFALDLAGVDNPVLVAGTDGVGTKLQLAFMADKHDTVGQDCVAMCVNDIVCAGARPLFFLDYIAVGKLLPEKVAQIVKGIADGCVAARCALIGGETAEMPGFYKDDEYDLAGFAVGIVSKDKIINGSAITDGDVLLGIESSGVHSNGFSLVRKLLAQNPGLSGEFHEALGRTVMEELLTPTRIYVDAILSVTEKYPVKGISHITGGGFTENIPRMLPKGLKACIKAGSWPVKPIFELIRKWGAVKEQEMYNAFNMGLGMVLAVEPALSADILTVLKQCGAAAHEIGSVRSGTGGVELLP